MTYIPVFQSRIKLFGRQVCFVTPVTARSLVNKSLCCSCSSLTGDCDGEHRSFIYIGGLITVCMEYDDMLSDARDEIPEPEEAHDRFQIPDVSGRIEGGRTIITNFSEVADVLRRDPSHLLKFLNRELATRGDIDGKTAELERRLRPDQLNEKISDYKDRFVTCPSCEKADTVLNHDGTDYTMKCEACGHVEEFTEKF